MRILCAYSTNNTSYLIDTYFVYNENERDDKWSQQQVCDAVEKQYVRMHINECVLFPFGALYFQAVCLRTTSAWMMSNGALTVCYDINVIYKFIVGIYSISY